jgi:hypothetical protein
MSFDENTLKQLNQEREKLVLQLKEAIEKNNTNKAADLQQEIKNVDTELAMLKNCKK